MTAPANLFKRRLLAKERQIGLWLALADAYCAEICAGAGFDWVLIDGEHAPNDLRSTLHQLQAVAGHPATQPVIRLPIGETHRVKQALDIGVQTILVPMIETADQAAAMVAACRYPPHGVRGVGSALARASDFNRRADYLATADAEICLLLQVESVAGMAEIERIAAIDGVDGIFIGPADLAASMGHLGQPGHAEVQAAVEAGFARILACGKPAGVLIADEALARRYLELGATFVAVGTDVSLLSRGASVLAARFRDTSPPAGATVTVGVY